MHAGSALHGLQHLGSGLMSDEAQGKLIEPSIWL